MSSPELKLAVVGHTNTGKTSLLRTLTRDRDFGRVAPGPSTTRRVEGAALIVGGNPRIGLFDTPGLEAAGEIYEWLQAAAGGRHDGPARIRSFLDSQEAGGDFRQEAEVLRQVLASDAVLYVIDAREPVLGKYVDELAVLALCARPVLPVMNFIADGDNRTAAWRDALARVNLHVQAGFDTVVFDADSELKLFEKLGLVLDAHGDLLAELIAERRAHARWQFGAALERIADMLVDVASARVIYEPEQAEAANSELQGRIIACEQACVRDLLALFRFAPEDYRDVDLPVGADGWQADPFDPETLRHYGIRTATPVAAGAGTGLVVDVATGGLSLGAGTAVGTVLGGAAGVLSGFGRRLQRRFRGRGELAAGDDTLRLLMTRQLHLLRELLVRGHASQAPIESTIVPGRPGRLPAALRRARHHPAWSRPGHARDGSGGPVRSQVVSELAEALETVLTKQ